MRTLSNRLAVPSLLSLTPALYLAVALAVVMAVIPAKGLTAAGAAEPAGPAHADSGYGDDMGDVRLPAECSDDEATRHLSRGLALLHHMTYEGSRAEFAAAAEADPACALAYWGQAMTYIHPLWSDPPTQEQFEHGRSLLAEARKLDGVSDREKDYLAAAEAYYAEGRDESETANLAAFAEAWEGVHERFPDDPEATAFHALSHLATADPADKSYAVQRRAGALAEGILDEIPNHPGGHHYTIHAYDYPPLAEEALDVARHYGEIAPAVPHALHMPTHVFTRRGLWEESIAWNERSAEAASRHRVEGAVSLHHLHALDYLAYAHLQRGDDPAAEAVGRRVAALEGPFQVEVASPYTLAAVPARLALERQRWAEAAALEPRKPSDYPWDRFPAIEAISHFARGLGAARSGDPERARAAAETLARLRDRAAETSAYWADQVEIQRLAVLAWAEHAAGETDKALATMRRAAEREAATEKHPVTPGEVLPAYELLGDMLMALDRPAEALIAYEAALERSPGRFNALYGAGHSAELAGDRATAARHYRKLVETSSEAATARDRFVRAREYLASTGASAEPGE